ncbi:uncharacterized protein DS421_20g689030 [Arachis hypogaea]|nr:uncharacterized protein DS421_20g689030 [Arachis hypogaea]
MVAAVGFGVGIAEPGRGRGRPRVPLPPEPPPELLATSAVAGKITVGTIGNCRRCRRTGSETAAVSVQPFFLGFELLRLLRKWLGAEVLVAVSSV